MPEAGDPFLMPNCKLGEIFFTFYSHSDRVLEIASPWNHTGNHTGKRPSTSLLNREGMVRFTESSQTMGAVARGCSIETCFCLMMRWNLEAQ